MRRARCRTGMSRDIALYIHIPFCRRKCRYCSFVSFERREADIPAYIGAVRHELAQRAAGQRVCTVYFGGGTPSLLSPAQVGGLLDTIRSLFTVDGPSEVTMEANPGTVDETYLRRIRGLGVNRLSLGAQSLSDAGLKLLGRIHTAAEARYAVLCARKAGFSNLNMDLMYGLPGQTLKAWRDTLAGAIEMGPEHLSLYPLSLEGDEPISLDIERGKMPAPDPDRSADQYEIAEEMLAAGGYLHYEISNWAKEGYECRHNLVYWRNRSYLGAGAAAHSHLGGRRFANTGNLDCYLAAFLRGLPPPLETDEPITPEMELSETVILGLRLSQGVRQGDIRQRFGVDLMGRYACQIEEMAGLGLIEIRDGCIRLTGRGRLLGNEVFCQFLPDMAPAGLK